MIQLRIHQVIQERGITPYRLWKETGLARGTVYAYAAEPKDRAQIDLDKLTLIVEAVERLSGRPVELADVFERAPSQSGT